MAPMLILGSSWEITTHIQQAYGISRVSKANNKYKCHDTGQHICLHPMLTKRVDMLYYDPKLHIFVANSNIQSAGLGVFAGRCMPKHHILGIYPGTHLSGQELHLRYPNKKYSRYVLCLEYDYYIDAADAISLLRFCNSPSIGTAATVEVTMDGHMRTTREIRINTELTMHITLTIIPNHTH